MRQPEPLQRTHDYALRNQLFEDSGGVLFGWKRDHDEIGLRRNHGQAEILQAGGEILDSAGIDFKRAV